MSERVMPIYECRRCGHIYIDVSSGYRYKSQGFLNQMEHTCDPVRYPLSIGIMDIIGFNKEPPQENGQ